LRLPQTAVRPILAGEKLKNRIRQQNNKQWILKHSVLLDAATFKSGLYPKALILIPHCKIQCSNGISIISDTIESKSAL
jgi:hypothetical protein